MILNEKSLLSTSPGRWHYESMLTHVDSSVEAQFVVTANFKKKTDSYLQAKSFYGLSTLTSDDLLRSTEERFSLDEYKLHLEEKAANALLNFAQNHIGPGYQIFDKTYCVWRDIEEERGNA